MGKSCVLYSDLDGSVAPYCSFEAPPSTRKGWNELREHAYAGIISGKSFPYVNGFLRFNFMEPDFISGENGGIIQVKGRIHTYDNGGSVRVFRESVYDDIKSGKMKIPVIEEPGKIVTFTLFTYPVFVPDLKGYASEKNERMGLGLDVIPHRDSIDVLPHGLDKSYSVSFIAERFGIDPQDSIGFGDGINDYGIIDTVGIPCAPANADPMIIDSVRKLPKGIVTEGLYGDALLEINKKIFSNGNGKEPCSD